jgi:GINS complex subunit 3
MEIIDQAQHFAVSGHGSSSSAHDDTAAAFREGLDGTERESEWIHCRKVAREANSLAVFALAQASARQTKQWYDSTDKGRR